MKRMPVEPRKKQLGGLRCWRAVRLGRFAGLLTALLPAVAGAEPSDIRDVAGEYRLSFLERSAPSEAQAAGQVLVKQGVSAEALEALFARLDYRLDRVRERGVAPRVLVRRMPDGLSDLRETKRRKALFIRIALPLILTANEAILRDRERLERLRAMLGRGRTLPAAEARWLWHIFHTYRVEPFDFVELLSRIDIVPPSLAVAQAAEETGWGTSRFVRRGNALFGERTYKSRTGMVPRRIPPGDNFRIRSFGQLLAAVGAYVWNLNTHPAYAEFRARRGAMRAAEGGLDATALAGGLEAYSVRRQAYVETVRTIMRTNALAELDHVKLDPGLPRFARVPAASGLFPN